METREYTVYLDGEECTAYGRVEAENLNEAIPALIEKMYDNISDSDEEGHWSFEHGKGNHIDMYFDDYYQNSVSVYTVD